MLTQIIMTSINFLRSEVTTVCQHICHATPSNKDFLGPNFSQFAFPKLLSKKPFAISDQLKFLMNSSFFSPKSTTLGFLLLPVTTLISCHEIHSPYMFQQRSHIPSVDTECEVISDQ